MEELFTEREREVFNLITKGKSNQEIAEELFITIYTVKAHVASILRKIGGRNRLDIILMALKNGILPINKNK